MPSSDDGLSWLRTAVAPAGVARGFIHRMSALGGRLCRWCSKGDWGDRTRSTQWEALLSPPYDGIFGLRTDVAPAEWQTMSLVWVARRTSPDFAGVVLEFICGMYVLGSSLCRLWSEGYETTEHVILECEALTVVVSGRLSILFQNRRSSCMGRRGFIPGMCVLGSRLCRR